MEIHQLKIIRRILDANLDRAREGLRSIEEWCRFGLENSDLTEQCKQMRQELGKWHHLDLKLARDTVADPGTDLSHPQEEARRDIPQLLAVNLARVQEALRVLEEYGKLYEEESPGMSKAFKQMRYQIYTLEKVLLLPNPLEKLKQVKLYLVTSPTANLVKIVEEALQGGLTLVQYRAKDLDDCVRIKEAEALAQLCHQYGALFLVNDRPDLALAVGADGIHLGQRDLPIAIARHLLGPQKIIGRSTTNPTEMAKAVAEEADYLGVGPVYQTPTKAGKAATGLEYVSYAATHSPLPWFAIGGITEDNLAAVKQAGATRVAVVRAIMEAPQPTLVTQAFLAQL